MGFFSNIFGKKQCAFCGEECGVMSRDKLADGQYICGNCRRQCSRYMDVYNKTKEQIDEHIAYMKKQDRLYNEVFTQAKRTAYPSSISEQGIIFADDLGMFYIKDNHNYENKELHELIRYDQVLAYKRYVDYDKKEDGSQVFKECGIKLKLVEMPKSPTEVIANGRRPHPYIVKEIKVCFTKRAVEFERADYSDNAKQHFDYIFGVHDSEKGLFNFGMTKDEQRNMQAATSLIGAFNAAVQANKTGDTELAKQKAEEAADAIAGANTHGLSHYSKLADAAESKIN